MSYQQMSKENTPVYHRWPFFYLQQTIRFRKAKYLFVLHPLLSLLIQQSWSLFPLTFGPVTHSSFTIYVTTDLLLASFGNPKSIASFLFK